MVVEEAVAVDSDAFCTSVKLKGHRKMIIMGNLLQLHDSLSSGGKLNGVKFDLCEVGM